MNRKMAAISGVLSAGFMTQSASAQQTLQEYEIAGQSDFRAVVSATIPLGGNRSDARAAPRLDLALTGRDYRPRDVQADTPAFRYQPPERRVAFSLTMEQNPRLLINGERITSFGPRLTADEDEERSGGGNTALYILGGVLVVGTVAAVVTTTEIRDEFSDAIGPAD